ncbi:hypothetical protein RclHR1_07760006 [Rhizophagus clarus]|uniref:Uncharacterized protein n=1 Tax=Rhizophagus clarus TaxID=94130 RepID=A0A2Z6S041_9GLOM|nr:hypothetical protein RclHR1_07760006 [Rhizophagus clarus]GES89012.1 hypothetical protein GLOIN_2v1633456 [Rhizophagus clarus]
MKNRTSSNSKNASPQNNVKILNIKRSDYLSYDDLRSMRKKVNELTTLNYENENTNNVNIIDPTGDFMQDLKHFEENYSGVVSIATLFCTINKLFEDVGWKFSNYNKLDGSKCELTNLITKQKFRINISFDEGYEADIKEHRMKKKNEKPEYFHVYDIDESKYLYMNNDVDKSKVVDLNDVVVINGVHDENRIDGKLQAYSAARTRIKRNLPDLQEEIYVILEEVSDEIRNRVTHFDDPFSLLKIFEQNSRENNNSSKEKFDRNDDQEYLTREYEKFENNNNFHFVLVEGINNVNNEKGSYR